MRCGRGWRTSLLAPVILVDPAAPPVLSRSRNCIFVAVTAKQEEEGGGCVQKAWMQTMQKTQKQEQPRGHQPLTCDADTSGVAFCCFRTALNSDTAAGVGEGKSAE